MSKKKNIPHSTHSHVKRKEPVVPVAREKIRQEPFKFEIKQFIPLIILLLAFFVLWVKPFDVKLMDPWFEGIPYIDSAKKVTDENLRNKLLDQAGALMGEQVRKHPYHARVHYLYGYYWFNRNNLDSVIAQQKEAIRLGVGGVVNQVEYDAQNMLNSAVINKIMNLCGQGKFKESFTVLEEAQTPGMINYELIKFHGVIFSRENIPDSALVYFRKYQKVKGNDVDNITNIGISYAQKNMRDSALIYAGRALQLDPNNNNAKYLQIQLTGKQ